MTAGACPKCGKAKCYIMIYWKKSHHRFWHDKDGDPLSYHKADRKLTKIRQEIDDKIFDPFDYILTKIKERQLINKIGEWLDQKKKELDNGELAISTYRHYRAYQDNYFKIYFKKSDCREIKFPELEAFKNWLADHGIKIKTRRNILNALHAFFTWLFQKGIISAIPAFPTIKGDDASVRISLEYGDQQTFLDKIPLTHRDVIEFGFETGLRPGELCALKICDMDLRAGKALIQRTLSCNEIRETTKAKNKRPIPLSDRALFMAKAHSEGRFGQEFLFLNPSTSRGYKTEFLRRLWREHSKSKVTLYEAMRHSFATQIIEGGADLATAQTLLRHADIRSTQAYFHANVNKLQDVVNSRGRVIKINERKVNAASTK
jgi:integrase/recombinase XerD